MYEKNKYNNIYDKIPGDDDLILVAYYKNEKHLKWILDNKLYNIRVKSHNQEKNVLNSCRNTQYLILYHYSGAKDSYIFSLKEKRRCRRRKLRLCEKREKRCSHEKSNELLASSHQGLSLDGRSE